MARKGFSDYDDEQLVEFVRNYRVLYDHDHPQFRNLTAKNGVWKSVAEAIGKNGDQCKKRWKDVRDNYYKTVRKGRLSTGSAAPFSTKKWPLFERLKFLNDVNRESPSFCNISQQETGNQQDMILSEEEEGRDTPAEAHSEITQNADNLPVINESEAPTTTTTYLARSKMVKRIPWDDIDKRGQKCMELLEQIANKKNEDDIDVFMKSIAMSVKKLPPHLISKAKIEILTTVSRLEEHASNAVWQCVPQYSSPN